MLSVYIHLYSPENW